MSLNAGSVFATLGGRFSPTGFNAFGSAMYRAKGQSDAFEKSQKQMAARAQRSYQAMGQAAKIGAAGGILALVAATGYAVKKAADFEQQLSATTAQGKQYAGALKDLRKQALDAGAATKFSALDAAKAQTELAKGGLSVKQILGGGLKAALSLAAAGELELADAATYTVNAMKLFKIPGEHAAHVADALATAANNTTADVQDFGMALVQGGGAAKSAGYDFDQTVTILEALAEVGVKNSDAGTSMKTALLQLISPTKKQAEASKQAGISFLDQHGKMKDLASISEMLRTKTENKTKAERTALFQTLAGTDGFRTLLALYDAGPTKLERLQKGLEKQGTAAEVAAHKQDNLKGRIENLGGSVETAAIRVGTKMLPALTKLATQGTQVVNAFIASGQADRFGEGLVNGLAEVVQVAGDVIGVGADVAGVLLDIGRALDLGDATKIEAILAAIAGFKIAGFVAPMVAALGGSIATLVANARTAPTVMAFLADIPLLANPIGLVALAAGGLGAALVLLGSHESAETGIARANAAAKRAQASAIKAVQDAELAAADQGLAAKQAELDHTRAVQHFNEVRKKAKKGSDEYKQALLDVQQTSLRVKGTQDAYTKSVQAQTDANQKAVNGARDRLKSAREAVGELQKQVDLQTRVDNPATGKSIQVPANANPATLRALGAALDSLTARNTDYIQAVARSTVSETNRQRLMSQSTVITRKNTVGVADLIRNLDGVPKQVQSKLLVQNQDALARAGSLSKQLVAIGQRHTVAKILTNAPSAGAAVGAFRAVLSGTPGSKAVKILQNAKSAASAVAAFKAIVAGVPASKALRILQNADSASGAISRLKAAIASLPTSKTITLTTNEIHTISNRVGGRPVGPTGKVGHASGHKTDGPELAVIGEGNGPEYVIPTEQRYRGRGIELLMQAAADLGISGFKKGTKKGKGKGKPHRWVPAPKQFLRLDPDQFTSDRNDAKQRLDNLTQDAKEKDAGGHLTKKALNARRKLGAARRAYQRERALAAKANAHARRVDAQESIAETARNEMDLADRQNKQGAYDKALKKRQKALGRLGALLGEALKYSKPGSKWRRDIQGLISSNNLDVEEAKGATSTAQSTAAGDLAETGMTTAEQTRLQAIKTQEALAALTADLGDDKKAAQAEIDFLTGVLGEVMRDPRRGGNPVIADIAGQLQTARDNLTSLSGSGTNTNPDLQAQIDQANTRATNAEEAARLSDAAVRALGTPDPRQVGLAPSITINTLHPGDPRTLDAIGRAATAGQGAQGYVPSPRVKLGV